MHIGMKLLALVSLSVTALAGQVTNLEQWVGSHASDVDQLLCEREVSGVYFLVASADSRIKTGYRIDVTSASGAPAPFIVGWRFQDQHGEFMEMAAEPDVIRKGYAREGNRIYAEEVAYRDIRLQNVERIRITLSLKIYDDASKVPSFDQFPDEEMEEVIACEVHIVPK